MSYNNTKTTRNNMFIAARTFSLVNINKVTYFHLPSAIRMRLFFWMYFSRL